MRLAPRVLFVLLLVCAGGATALVSANTASARTAPKTSTTTTTRPPPPTTTSTTTTTQPTPTPTTTQPTPTGQPSQSPIYGLTIDGISNIGQVVAMEQGLPVQPTTRVVFDWNSATRYEPASHYAAAIKSLDPVSGVMGDLLDSSYEKGVTPATFQTMVESYLQTLGSTVNIWEIGNEVNGNWTGPYATVAANLAEAYNDVAAAGDTSALTLYANEYAPNNCGDGTGELTPVQFSEQYVPASVRDGLSYVFESYYPTQCEPTTYPTSAEVAAEMEALHALYPNALVGFGEMGLPDPVTTSTLSSAEQVMSWAYGLSPGLNYYAGGYFWWSGDEDLVSATQPLYPSFVSALEAEHAALG